MLDVRNLLSVLLLALGLTVAAQEPGPLDETRAGPGEWGRRPGHDEVLGVSPPAFCWRPDRKIVSWELLVGEGRSASRIHYRAEGIAWNVHCPPRIFPPGTYTWIYRGVDRRGRATTWSRPYRFKVAQDAAALPLPARKDLLARIPRTHPRLFLRPEDLPRLRSQAQGDLGAPYRELVKTCEKLLKNPPPTAEPPKYPGSTVPRSEAWRKIWWGNRTYTVRALNAAATLAFTRLLDGNERYGRLARRILLDCARWDPRGATGYRYNDEAGMPYAYHFARTYTFVHDLLSEEERALCGRVMAVRGREMYRHLCPRHLWKPYNSHANRAWHFLGEVGMAFQGEIPEAADWVWFAANVFTCVYPVWSDEDGGWHEGSSYWAAYLHRFTWWADVMKSALGIDAYRKPFFAQAGFYPLYLMPPGKRGGGFGDLTATRTARQNVPLVTTLASQAHNPSWQWYVEAQGGPRPEPGYIGFIRGGRPRVKAQPPDDLPTSRLFRGTGQAVLNTTLLQDRDNVQVVFKSSPFGTQSHGYEANNAFLLSAFGERLLIRTGRRDMYGSDHHRRWMWSTRSVNGITVNDRGQLPHSARTRGQIVAFTTEPRIDVVQGEAGSCYQRLEKGLFQPVLDRFTRTLVFVKPDRVLVHDRLDAREPSVFTSWLHAVNEIQGSDPRRLQIRAGEAACDASLIFPPGLVLSQTDQYDPNPRPRVKLREWHLSARTTEPRKSAVFLSVFRPRHQNEPAVWDDVEVMESEAGVAVRLRRNDGHVVILFPTPGGPGFEAFGLKATTDVMIGYRDLDGRLILGMAVPGGC